MIVGDRKRIDPAARLVLPTTQEIEQLSIWFVCRRC